MQLIGRDRWYRVLTISSLLGIDKSVGGDGDEEEAEGQIARSSRVTTTTAMCITSRAQDSGERFANNRGAIINGHCIGELFMR